MNIYTRLSALHTILIVTTIFLAIGCTQREPSEHAPNPAEKDVIESALANFAHDWGMPGHREAVPKECYLRNTYASVDHVEITAAAAASDQDGARRAVTAIASGSPQAVLTVSNVPCKLSTPEEIEKIESGGHVYQGGIIIVSHAGFDAAGENAAILLGEVRGDLAGSMWIIFLKKSSNGWLVVERHILKQS